MDKKTQKTYDQIIAVVINNVMSERMLNGKIILRDFDPTNPNHRLYYMASMILADARGENIYLSMPFLKYIKFRWQTRKRKNLHYLFKSDIEEIELCASQPDYEVATVDTLMDYISRWAQDTYGITLEEFRNIFNEVYGE